ncbi:DUF6318 family protein [Schaalia georgiae]|uniref:DUF6318 family protein n=1 Tax=Schaalia georgiae TaxID=52768 RepID=UPI001FB07739|nr:DUF6318 family protein [Schaalia georgiae]
MGVEDTPLSDGAARSGGRDDRERLIAGVDSSDSMPIETIPSSGAHALSGSGGDAPSDGAHTFLSEDRPDSGIAGDGQGAGPETDNAAVGDPSADGPASGLPDGGPADDTVGDQSAEVSVGDGFADAGDGGGGGMSPVVREYVERLRSEALARDAQLRARGIDPYKGTPVDEKPRRRWGARALAALVVLVAVVSVGAYVVFFHGEPDYGMSHGYQVQSDGSLKRPSTPVHQPSAPAELLRFTDDASEIAATHYFEAVAYAWNTGDTQYMRAFSSPDCQFCQKTADDIDRLYEEGGWASGAKFTNVVPHPLGRYSDVENYGEDTYGVRVSFHQLTPDLYAHNAFHASEERDDEVTVLVHWDGQRWAVRELGRDQNTEGSN